MSQQDTDLGVIEHLDFEVEEEKKEKTRHYSHPTDPTIRWCGEPKETPVIPGQGWNWPASGITCVKCLHLYIEKGPEWWWRVNRAWYGT